MNNNCHDEELILEGPKVETSKMNPIVQEDTMQNIPLMPMKMEITSIKDFKVQEESQNVSKGEVDQEEKFYDALDEYFSYEEVKMAKARKDVLANN